MMDMHRLESSFSIEPSIKRQLQQHPRIQTATVGDPDRAGGIIHSDLGQSVD